MRCVIAATLLSCVAYIQVAASEDVTAYQIVPEQEPATPDADLKTPPLGKMKFTPPAHWPEYARHCDESGHWCKPPQDFGGCVTCESGWLYGKSLGCKAGYSGWPCDFGPYECGGRHVCTPAAIKERAAVDKSLILTALHLANIIYETGKRAQEKACHGVTSKLPLTFTTYTGHDTKVAWGVGHGSFGQHNGEKLYTIAFRGTVSATNWLTNFKLFTQDLPKGRVHKGFYDALEPHKADLIGQLKKMMNGHKRILVTGHSLGGALATLFALYVAEAF